MNSQSGRAVLLDDRFLPAAISAHQMEPLAPHGIDDLGQDVEVVVAAHGIGGDPRLGQLNQAVFQGARGLEESVFVIDHVASQRNQVDIQLDCPLDNTQPHLRARIPCSRLGASQPAGPAADVNVSSRKNTDLHGQGGIHFQAGNAGTGSAPIAYCSESARPPPNPAASIPQGASRRTKDCQKLHHRCVETPPACRSQGVTARLRA